MIRLIILPIVLIAAAVALVLWAAYDFHIDDLEKWDEMYD